MTGAQESAIDRACCRENLMRAALAALRLTEDNLSRLISAKHPDEVLMTPWRDHIRAVLARAAQEAGHA
ncbi:hypothetical protein [Cupriavidus pauculus]|uniref:hypothetical protein n=1 Tax=Cupriavidus pauculus TaxID=82633 RepID=UPI003857BB3E